MNYFIELMHLYNEYIHNNMNRTTKLSKDRLEISEDRLEYSEDRLEISEDRLETFHDNIV